MIFGCGRAFSDLGLRASTGLRRLADIHVGSRICQRAAFAPLPGLPVAQPEHAGAHVRRQLDHVVHRDRLAVVAEDPGHLPLHARGAREQGGHHGAIGRLAALLYSMSKVWNRGDPSTDGAARYLELCGEGLVGGAHCTE
ncbi:MAG TPA: hypothetical protein VK777_32605 [Reyranella sp.]|nr:hypothetical protein [Reyranella sp.]